MKKKIIFLIILVFTLKIDVHALTYGGCDYSSVSRLKSLIGNINISYDYKIIDNQAYFDVTLNNIPEDVYFIDNMTNITYTYSNTENGEITISNYTGYSGSYKFYSALADCYGITLGTKYYKFPIYNIYYSDPLCSDIPNYSLCQKWSNVNYSYDQFKNKIYEYKEKINEYEDTQENVEYNKGLLDNIVEFYVNYYYYFLGTIILICGIIIVIKRRKDRFKL